MAGPNVLNYNEEVGYPTWQAGKSTRLYIQNLDRQYTGKVNVFVYGAGLQEDVFVSANQIEYIDRDWAGLYIQVTNNGGPTMKVWTE